MNYSSRAVALAATILSFQNVSADSGENLIVTANRTGTSADRVIVPVSVIDRETIERNLALELSDILRFQADLDIVRSGGPGSQTSIFTRGTESNHTLVMIDGVRINNGSVGTAPIEFIAPDFIERIEVVKAPRTSLYGEDAIGGVINIITRKPDGTQFSAFGGGGADNTKKFGAAGGTEIGPFDLGLHLQRTDTDGFPTIAGETEDRGYENTTAAAIISADFENWKSGVHFWQSEGTTEYFTSQCNADFTLCNNVPVDQDYTNRALALSATTGLTNLWTSHIKISNVFDELEENQSPDSVETDRWAADWQNDFKLSEGLVLVGGLFYSTEDVDAVGLSNVSEKTNVKAAYVESNSDIGRHAFVVAGRFSDHDAFGSDFTWNLEYGFDISEAWRLTTSAGRAVRAPTAFDRFGFGGNPDLNEEEAITIQGGIEWKISTNQLANINFFHSDIDNLIAWNSITFSLENIDESEIKGVEATYKFTGQTWDFSVAGLLQDPKNKTTGNTLARRAEESISMTFMKYIAKHNVGIDFITVGSREDFGGEMAGYGLTNLTGQFVVNNNWSINARVENLFDKEYFVAHYGFGVPYTTPDRGAYVEVRYRLSR